MTRDFPPEISASVQCELSDRLGSLRTLSKNLFNILLSLFFLLFTPHQMFQNNRIFRRHILPYWKTFVVVLTPLLLLPLPLVLDGPVSSFITIQMMSMLHNNIIMCAGSSGRIWSAPNDYFLAHFRLAIGRYIALANCRVSANRHPQHGPGMRRLL